MNLDLRDKRLKKNNQNKKLINYGGNAGEEIIKKPLIR
jgi:hypothetical protein